MLRWAATTAALLGALTACSGSGKGPSATIDLTNPSSAVHQALDAMDGLNSYRMDMAFSPEGVDIPAQVDYHSGNYYERITDPGSGSSTDLISAGYLFTRDCSDASHCDGWVRHPGSVATPGTIAATRNRYSAPTLGGLTTTFPETLAFTAVDLASDWRQKDNSSATLTGEVDLARAIDENRSRIGIRTGTAAPSETPLPASRIELSLSDSGPYFEKVTIDVPGDSTNPYFVVSFSRFNDVSVDAPGDYTTGPH